MPRKSFPSAATLLSAAGFALAACGQAQAMSVGQPGMPGAAALADWIGFRDISYDSRDLFAWALLFYALGFGYLTDLALHDRGFGKILNGVVGAAGICIALHFAVPHLVSLGRGSEAVLFNLMMIVACAGSAITLVAAAAFKGVFMHALRLNLDRLGRAPPPRPIAEPVEPLNPRIAAALRDKY